MNDIGPAIKIAFISCIFKFLFKNLKTKNKVKNEIPKNNSEEWVKTIAEVKSAIKINEALILMR